MESTFLPQCPCPDRWRAVHFWLAHSPTTYRVNPWHPSGPVDSPNFQDWPLYPHPRPQNKSNMRSHFPGLMFKFYRNAHFWPFVQRSLCRISLFHFNHTLSDGSTAKPRVSITCWVQLFRTIPTAEWRSHQHILWLDVVYATSFWEMKAFWSLQWRKLPHKLFC